MQQLIYKRDVSTVDFGLTPEQEQRARELHEKIIVFDSLIECCWYDEFIDTNLTRGLVARGYSDGDITRVMGGNWVRLIEETVE